MNQKHVLKQLHALALQGYFYFLSDIMNFNKQILVFGAGKSATVLIDYLKIKASEKNWGLTVADNNLALAQLKVGDHPLFKAVQINIENGIERKQLIRSADLVISMMPPVLHYLVAVDCLEFGKHLLTASYADPKIKELSAAIEDKGLLFLYEMGLDPGIDHMSAMKLIDGVKSRNGKITSFVSHCGGLVAPENDDNPWHYKISWNPRNVVLAGKAGAIYKKDGKVFERPYETLFEGNELVNVPGLFPLSCYPNRDSLSYINLYDLADVQTFIRTTLRYPEFNKGWHKIVELELTDEKYRYPTEGISVAAFFEMHLKRLGLNEKMASLKTQAETDAEAFDILKQLQFLGLEDDTTTLPVINGTAADVLQFLLENKLALKPGEKDMIVMLHELEYTLNGLEHRIKSSLVALGSDDQRTAMAKTVGLPLGIAAVLILEGKITEKGLHIPISSAIYEPVLSELEKEGIVFQEIHT